MLFKQGDFAILMIETEVYSRQLGHFGMYWGKY